MEYKETLNLPRTDFAMKADLVTREPERLKSGNPRSFTSKSSTTRRRPQVCPP